VKQKTSKTEIENKIKDFFQEIKDKSPKEIKKIKKLAMNRKISLKERRKLFCKYCLNPYSGKEKIRINKRMKMTNCNNCEKISRWKIK